MSLTIGGFDGSRLGEVKDVTAHGVPGCGVYVLSLHLKVSTMNFESEVFLSELSSQLELGESALRIARGRIEGHPVIRWSEYSSDETLRFIFYLSASQVQAIETYRGGTDLKLGIWLSGKAKYENSPQHFSDKEIYTVPKQQWLKALSMMNFKHSMLFELPMPKEGDDDVESYRILLERAQSHILNGHYQESVGLCRQVIEYVENYKEDKKDASEAVKKYKNDRKNMTTMQRILFLREALKNITHLGNHPGEEFSRHQAQAILGMTVALLSSPEIGITK